jgi:hypothetical protein
MITVRQLVTRLDRDGIESFTLGVRHAVGNLAQRHGQQIEEYLDARELRGLYRRATNYHNLITEYPDGECEVNPDGVDLLLSCLRRLHIPVDQLISSDYRSRPWDMFCAGDTLIGVLGGKLVEGPLMSQYYVSQRDTESKNALIDHLRERQRLAFHPDEECLSTEIPPEEAKQALKEYRKRADVGMIVIFGSSIVNPLANPVAGAIMENAGLAELPAWFELPSPPKKPGAPRRPDSLLMRRSKSTCGVRLAAPVMTSGGLKNFFPRVGRDDVLRRFQEADRGPYEDAGILMLDTTCVPMLCLVAGHGGCGTQAALQALLDDEAISRDLVRSQQGGSVLGPGRLMQVIEVCCTKRTERERVDDLEFQPGDWTAYTLPAAAPAPCGSR